MYHCTRKWQTPIKTPCPPFFEICITLCTAYHLRINKTLLSSKLALSKTFWQMLKVLPQLSPLVSSLVYVRALCSTAMKSNHYEYVCCKGLLPPLLLCLEKQGYIVPHFKALRWGKDETRKLSYSNTYIICQAFLKSAYLLNKQGFVDSKMAVILGE